MSKNAKIRTAGEPLPKFPKFKADGSIMRDYFGNTMYVDHFKEINRLRKAAMGVKKVEDRLVMDYMKKVRTYAIRRENRIARRNRILLITVTIIIGLAVFFYLNNYATIK